MFSPCHAPQAAHEKTPRSVIGARRRAVRCSRFTPKPRMINRPMKRPARSPRVKLHARSRLTIAWMLPPKYEGSRFMRAPVPITMPQPKRTEMPPSPTLPPLVPRVEREKGSSRFGHRKRVGTEETAAAATAHSEADRRMLPVIRSSKNAVARPKRERYGKSHEIPMAKQRESCVVAQGADGHSRI